MTERRSSKDTIPKEELTAYERWELPLLSDGKPLAPVRPAKPKPLTVEDLEQISAAAAAEGRDEGLRLGRDEGIKLGKEEGLKAGRVEGEKLGLAKAEADNKVIVQRLEALMRDLLEPIRVQQDSVEVALVNLTVALTRSVIMRELELGTRPIKAAIHEALESLPSLAGSVSIIVNPADARWVGEAASNLANGARVVESKDVLPGGVVVETSHSVADFTIEKRFQKAVQQMLDRHIAQAKTPVADLSGTMGELTEFHRDVLEEAPSVVTPEVPNAADDTDDTDPLS